jgi:WD40 repeat protein
MKDSNYPNRSPLKWLLDRFFGFDFFISHPHSDGKGYAGALHERLVKHPRRFDCFIDVRDFHIGSELAGQQGRALKKTTRLLVIVTPAAHQSAYVRSEIADFKKHHPTGVILPIGTMETLAPEHYPDSELLPLIPHLPGDLCLIDNTSGDQPSDGVVEKIASDFLEQKSSEKRLRFMRVVASILALLLMVAIVLGILAEVRRREVTRNLSRASFVQAIRLLEDRQSAEALAYLARALRIDPRNRAASVRLFTLLTQRNFALCMPSAVGEDPPSEASPDDLFPAGSRTADGTARLKQDEKDQWLFSLTTSRVQNKTFRFAPAGSDPWSPDVSSIFNKDGSLVAICVALPRASFIGMWNANGELICETIHVPENIDHVWFDPVTGFLVLHNVHSDLPGHLSSAWNIASGVASADVSPRGETTRVPAIQKDLLLSRDEEQGVAIPHTRLRIRKHPHADDYDVEVCEGSTIKHKLMHDDAVYCFVPSASGRFVATGSGDGTARIWNPKDGQPITGVLNAGKKIWCVRFSEDEKLLGTATGSPSDDETSAAQLWDVVTGLPISDPYPFEGAVDTVHFTSDNRQLVVEVAAESPTGDPPLLSYTAVLSVSFSTKSAIPEWLPALAEAVGGYTVNEAGSLEQMMMDRRTKILKEIQAQITASDDDDAKQFGTWFFAQRTTRPIRPFSETDPQQWRNSTAQLHFSEPVVCGSQP